MAEKSTKLQSKGDYQLDDSLDIPDFNFDFDEPKVDNNPILSTLKEIGKGALGSIFNKGLVRSTIKNSLPEAYGTAYDFYDQAKESVKSLYNDAARELKPAEGQIKQITRRYLPKTEGILPAKIGEKLKDWSATGTASKAPTTQQLRNDSTAMELGSIFKAQAEDQDRRDDSQQKREHLNQGIEQIRHRDMLSGLTAIDMGVSRLAAYQDNVLANYQKKSLELQFRQYFVTADILNEVKKKAQTDRYQLEAIVKNTGLSDYAKLKTSDALKQATRNKFMEVGSKALFGGAGDGVGFIKQYIDNIKKSVGEKVKGGVEGVRGAADSLDMINSVSDSVGDMGGPGKVQMAAGIAGGFAGSGLLAKGQKWLRGKLDANPQINNVADRLQYGMNNFAQIATDRINDPSKPLPFGAERARGFLQDNLPANRPDTNLDTLGLMAQNQPAIYSNAAQKSLVEVIPGLLARIQRELVITRTGKDADLITYDYKSNKFSTTKAVGKGVLASIAGEGNRKDVDDRLEEIIKSIDPNGALHADDKKAIKDKLTNISVNRGSADPATLVNPGNFRGAHDPKAVAKAFQDHFQSDEDGKIDVKNNESVRNRRVVADQIARLTKYFNDPRAQIQEMARLGQTDALEQSGVYNRADNRLDLNKISSALRGEDINGGIPEDPTLEPAMAESTAGAGGGPPTRRRVKVPGRVQPGTNLANLPPQPPPPPITPPAAIPVPPPPPQANVAPLVQNVKTDNTDIIKTLELQTAQIEKLQYEPLFQKMLDELVKINTNLEGGINTYSMAEDFVGPQARQNLKGRLGSLRDRVTGAFGRARTAVTDPANIQAAKDRAQALKDKATDAAKAASDKARDLLGRGKQTASKSLSDMTLGEIGNSALSTAANLGSRALSGAKVAANIGSGLLRQGASIGGALLAKGSQKAADIFGDVYLPSENNPRLTRGNMKAGMYFDKATGKLIKSFKDMTGAVADKDGNVLLDEDQVKVAYVKGDRMTALKEAISEAGGTLKDLAGMAAVALGGAYGLGLRAAIAGFKTARAMLPPYDVYLKTDMKTPKLRKQGFTDRLYISKNTGKRLTHPREIDGVILDDQGNQLITDDDYNVGLVDVKGVTIKGPGRLIGKASGLIQKGLGFLKGVAGNAKEFLVGIGQAVKDIFGGVFGLKGEYLQTSMKQLDVQQAILKVLTDRLPPARKKVLGDENGDGIREGSGDEQLKAEEAADKAKRDGKPVDPNAEANGVQGKGGIGAMLANLFKKKKKDGDEDKEGGDTNIDLGGNGGKVLSAEEKAAAKAARAAEKAGAKGFKGNAARLAKGAGRGLWGAAKWGGRAALGMVGLEGAGALIGGVGSTLAAGASAVGTGALAVGGAALEGGAALAAGLGAVISAPVVLAALGVAAVGLGAYYGYKYLTRAKLETLNTVRYAQYGFGASDKDHFGKIFELEDKLEKNVKIDGKTASFTDKLDVEDLANGFGAKKGTDAFNSWVNWFTGRFKPIYLAHRAVLPGIKPDVKLGDVDSKLNAKEKLAYLEASTIPNGPYDVMDSPFYDDLKQLTVGSDGVSSAIQVARSDLQEQAKKEATDKKSAVIPDTNATKTLAKGAKSATGAAAAAGASGAAGAAALAPDKARDLQKNLSGTAATDPTSSQGTTLSVTNTIPADQLIYTGQNGRLDALTTVRMKTYGLVAMDVDKVKQLRLLEVQVFKNLKTNKEGTAYEEDVEALLDRVKSSFGVSGAHSERGVEWVKWFRNRFLPVFLNYTTMVGKVTNKKATLEDSTLTPQQQVDVANAITTTSTIIDGSRVSVWKIDNSPWDNYTLNLDENTIKANLEYMTQAIKAAKLQEQMAAKVKDASKQAVKDGKAVPVIAPVGAANAPAGTRNPNEASTKDQIDARNKVAANGYVQANEQRADGKGTRAIGDFTSGSPIEHPGKGTGGDINALPVPTADGYAGMKDLLAAVSKMTGTPLSPLVTTAAVESNFQAGAMPPPGPDGRRASGAVGLFQFIPSTWNMMLKNYGPKYGIAPNTPPSDPRANALMGAEFLKENLNALMKSKKDGKPVTDTDLYLAHFLGAGGANQFLKGDPNSPAAEGPGMGGPKGPAASNPTIFFDKRRNGAPRTYGEIYQLFTDKINKAKAKFSLGNDTSVSLPKADDKKGDPANVTAPTGAAGKGAPDNSPRPLPAGQVGPPAPGGAATPDAAAPPSPAKTGAAALVASSTPAGSATGASSSSGYAGSIAKVTGAQAPQPTAPVTVQTPTPTPAAPPAPTIVRSAPNYTGFNPNLSPSPAELGAQSSAASASMGGDIKSMAQTLLDSLKIQTSSRDLLQAIATSLGKQGTGPAATAAPTPTTGGTPPPAPTAPAPKAPISMARQN